MAKGEVRLGGIKIDASLGTASIKKNSQEISRTLRKMSSSVNRMGRDFGRVGSQINRALTLPMAAFGAATIKASVDINKGMAQIATLIDEGGSSIQTLKGDIQDLAVQSGKSTKDLSDGMFQVISAFGDAEDNAEKLGVAVKASVAGGSTTADAINLISAVTKAYGDTSVEAQKKVSDLAFITNKLGQTTFPELAANMGKVTGAAATLGVSQEELFAVFSTTTGVVGSTAEASTQLKAIFTALNKPTKELEAVMGALGVKTGEQLIANKGLKGSLDAIVTESERMGVNLAKVIGSAEAYNTLVALADSQSQKFADSLDAMAQKGEATEVAYKAVTEGVGEFGFKLQQLTRVVEVTAQKIGDSLTSNGVLGEFVDSVSDGIVKLGDLVLGFADLDPRLQNFTLAFGGIVTALGLASTAVAGVAAVIGGALLVKIGLATAAIAGMGAAAYAFKDDFVDALTEVQNFFTRWGQNMHLGVEGFKALFSDMVSNPFGKGNRTERAIDQVASQFASGAQKISSSLEKVQSDMWDGFMSGAAYGSEVAEPLMSVATAADWAAASVNELNNQLGGSNSKATKEAQKRAAKLAEALANIKDEIAGIERSAELKELKTSLEKALEAGDNAKFEQLGVKFKEAIKDGVMAGLDEGVRDSKEAGELANLKAEVEFGDYSQELEKKAKENANSWQQGFEDALGNFSVSDALGKGFNEAFGGGGELFAGLLTGKGGVGGAVGQLFGKDGALGALGLGGSNAGLYAAIVTAIVSGLSNGFKRLKDDDLKYSTGKERWQAFDLAVTEGAGSVFGVDPETNSRIDSFMDGINNLLPHGSTTENALFPSLNPIEAYTNTLQSAFGIFGSNDFGKNVRAGIEESFKELIQNATGGNGIKIQTPDGGVALLDMIHFFNGGVGDKFNNGGGFEFFNSLDAKAKNTFTALADAFAQIFELPEDFDVGQLAAVLSENLLGDIDNARMFVQQLQLDFEDLKEAAFTAARQGDISWREFNETVAGLGEAFGEGRAGVADMAGAVEAFVGSGARGFASIKGLRDLAFEFGEAGVSSMEEFQEALVANGLSAEQAQMLIDKLVGAGIDSLDDLKEASEETIGSIVGALDQENFGFTNMEQEIQDVREAFEELQSVAGDIESNVRINVQVNGAEDLDKLSAVSPEVAKAQRQLNSMSNSSTSISRALRSTDGVQGRGRMQAVNINIDASNADPGVEGRIMEAMAIFQAETIEGAVNAMFDLRETD